MRRAFIAIATASTLCAAAAAHAAEWPLVHRLPHGAQGGIAAPGLRATSPAGTEGSCGRAAQDEPAAVQGAAVQGDDPADDTRVAVIEGEAVTYGELRKRIGMKLTQSRGKYLRARRELEQKTLTAILDERLVAREAARRKITPDALLLAEVEAKVPEPTDVELKATYERFKERLPAPLEDVKIQLVAFLKSRASGKRKKAFMAELRASAGVRETLPDLRLPEVVIPEDGAPAKGPLNAPIKVVVYSDFECPFCSRVVPTLNALFKKYEGRIRIVFRDFPLSFHENAQRASEASLCAHDQNKFWEFHDHLFANQDKLTEKDLIEHAQKLNLDKAIFEACLKGGKHTERVKLNQSSGEAVGVNGTPAMFINGTLLSGAQPLDAMVEVVESHLKSPSK